MLGSGLIGHFYTRTLHEGRSPDRVEIVYSRTQERARAFAEEWGIPQWTTDLEEAITSDAVDVVVIGLPNQLHERCVELACEAGKAVWCTKPLGRTAEEARRMLEAVESAGVHHGYLEDLVYTPKTLGAVRSVEAGAIGDVLTVRSRECHPGPHSAWFWDAGQAGGGAIVDLGCHCIEVIRCYVGKDVRPVEVMCWADTLVHPIEAEDHAMAMIKFASGAMGQFDVGWAFKGGLDLRDEVSGTEGSIWLNHFLRTGFEMYAGEDSGYLAEKSEQQTGWVFPVGDEVGELGYRNMFSDMLESLDAGTRPSETFYDGYVVNAVIDACYRSATSRQWEPVVLDDWRGGESPEISKAREEHDGKTVIKRELLPDGRLKLILKGNDGTFEDRIVGDARGET